MKTAQPGLSYEVQGGYPYELPNGLKAGDLVRAVSFDHGYWTVEKDGQEFRVFQTNLETGSEYRIGERWLPADHPLVKRERRRGLIG